MQLDFASFVIQTADRPGKDANYHMDFTKAREELNWSPAYTLDNGISGVIDWAQANLEEIKTMPLNYIHQA